MPKIIIVGGGIAGLTVAHECIEAGIDVTILERTERWGGRALSYRLDGVSGPIGAPVEHSIRSFQSTYFSLFETMLRIPFGMGSTYDNLHPLPGLLVTAGGCQPKSGFVPDMHLSTSTRVSSLRKILALVALMRAWGVRRREIVHFFTMVAGFILTSRRVQNARFGTISFIDYAGLGRRSPAYRAFLQSFSEIGSGVELDASATVILDYLSRLFVAPFLNPYKRESLLNITTGPVNECFIDPWVDRLREAGCVLKSSADVIGFERDGDRIVAATLADGTHLAADAFVIAVATPALESLVPELYRSSRAHLMKREWSGGFQFFLREIPARLVNSNCFNMVFSSPWALIYLVECPAIWKCGDLPEGLAAVLSITFSNVETPGVVHGKPFHACTWDEVQDELLAQIGFVERDLIIAAHIDPLMRYVPEAEYLAGRNRYYRGWATRPANTSGCVWLNAAPLCASTPASGVGSIAVRPGRENLFLAGEYTATFMKTPTMEKANQAGKLCAAALCAEFGIEYQAQRLVVPRKGIAQLLPLG